MIYELPDLVRGPIPNLYRKELSVVKCAEPPSTDVVSTLFNVPPSVRLPLARRALTVSLPPFFKAHPKLNPATGRVLSRPLGGEGALNTWFEGSESDLKGWRRQVGLAAVVNCIVDVLQVRGMTAYLLPHGKGSLSLT